MAARDSTFDASKNPQVLMTMASACEASLVIVNPSWANNPSIRSLSTRFLGHPRLTNATDLILAADLAIRSPNDGIYNSIFRPPASRERVKKACMRKTGAINVSVHRDKVKRTEGRGVRSLFAFLLPPLANGCAVRILARLSILE